jgi:ubiquinone biosynthesis protein
VHARLAHPDNSDAMLVELKRLRQTQQQSNRLLTALTAVLAVSLAVALWALSR